MRFGRLIAIKQVDDYINPSGRHYAQWLCKCDCGNEVIAVGGSLTYGTTKSCGCLTKELSSVVHKKHNKYDLSGEYGIIYTSNGEEYWFDKEDYDKIKDYYWRKDPHGYLRSQIFDTETKKIYLFFIPQNCDRLS